MASPVEIDPSIDTRILARTREAVGRWDARTAVRDARTAAVKGDRPLDGDSRSRLAMRMNNIIADVRRSSQNRRPPSSPVLKQLIEKATPIQAEDLSADLVKEVVLNARDFLSVEFLERGWLAAKSVGRILIRTGSGLRARGTGFLVGPGLALTNEHVLPDEAFAAACTLEMDYEHNLLGPAKQPQTFVLEPKRFFVVDAKLDFALVAVADHSDRGADLSAYGWLPLNGAQGKIAILDGDYLNIIQHPLGREKEIVLRENRVLDLRTGGEANSEEIGPFIHYEADTEKGSSGSPVLNDQWDVVALHHTGVPKRDAQGNWLDKDNRIWRENEQPIDRIQWVANEGIRVSSLVAAVTGAQVKPEQRGLLDGFLAAKPAPFASPPNAPKVAAPQPAATTPSPRDRDREAMDAGAVRSISTRDTVSFDFPLRITVSLGETAVDGSTQAPARQMSLDRAELLTERLDPEDYADRAGYDRHFLGVDVPLPTIKNGPRFGGLLRVPRPARPRDINELRYHHYSILMNAKRRLAYVSACNVDFDPGATVAREDGTGSWRLDPRLDKAQQIGGPYYDNNDYDKGHLTRRDDAAWGRDDDEALAANNDTFHYPNAGPEHFLFNRSTEFTHANLDLWGDLENHITKQGAGQRTRLSIFNGPIFTAHDKPWMDAFAPLSYFKIVIWRDGTQQPGAIGFVLEQGDLIRELPEEAIEPGRFKIRQKRIAQIERSLDISFGPVGEWDAFADTLAEEALDNGILITKTSDIRLKAYRPD
jgi:endonuclease G, mitochondrial